MKFSKTTEYALQILVWMATHQGRRSSSADLYEALKIPKKYLQQLLTQLSKKGLITGSKGRYGGFVLSRQPASITIAEIVNAIEGLPEDFSCLFGYGNCARTSPCPVHDSWIGAQSKVLDVLSATKLSDIIG